MDNKNLRFKEGHLLHHSLLMFCETAKTQVVICLRIVYNSLRKKTAERVGALIGLQCRLKILAR